MCVFVNASILAHGMWKLGRKERVSYYVSKGSVAIWVGICEKKKIYICKGKSKIRSQVLNCSYLEMTLTGPL